MSSFSEAVEATSLFAETVLSVQKGDLAIDEEATEKIVSLDPAFVPHFNVAEGEGEECVRKTLEQFRAEISARIEPAYAFDADDESGRAFIDVGGDGRGVDGAECERFPIAGALIWANLLSEIILESVVDTSKLPFC